MRYALILGGGFAGLNTAVTLVKNLPKKHPHKILLINRDNFFLFTPQPQSRQRKLADEVFPESF